MVRKKTIESVEETKLPRALIVSGGEESSFLTSTLKDRGCEVLKLDSYSLTPGRFDYIFLFDNQSLADEIYEKNLLGNGKFILVLTDSEISDSVGAKMGTRSHFRIIKIGDPAFWSLPQLGDKILRTLFSSSGSIVNLSRKSTVSLKTKKALNGKPI